MERESQLRVTATELSALAKAQRQRLQAIRGNEASLETAEASVEAAQREAAAAKADAALLQDRAEARLQQMAEEARAQHTALERTEAALATAEDRADSLARGEAKFADDHKAALAVKDAMLDDMNRELLLAAFAAQSSVDWPDLDALIASVS